MPLSFATPPGVPKGPGEIDLPDALRSAPFLSAWSGSALHGFESGLRLGGVFVESADVVLGLRSWNDAREGVLNASGSMGAAEAVPYAIFEVEKIVRMMLHQSGLAFEILASPVLFEADLFERDSFKTEEAFPARRIANAAVTSGLLHHYRDIARGTLARLIASKGRGARVVDILELARVALTGRALMQAEVDFNLGTLLENYAPSKLSEFLENTHAEVLIEAAWLQEFERHIEDILKSLTPEDSALPQRPSDYDWLNDFVISSRLEQLKTRNSGGPS